MSMLYIGIASVVVSAVGAGVSYAGQKSAANAAESAAAMEANEKRLQARSEAERAAENARRAEQEKSRFLARQRAELAASGLAMEGTPIAVLGDSARTLEMEILDIGHQAEQRRRALLAGASVAEFEGKATASSLRTQATAGLISSVASTTASAGKAGGYLS